MLQFSTEMSPSEAPPYVGKVRRAPSVLRSTLLLYTAVFQYDDMIGSCDGTHPVSDDKHRFVPEQMRQSLLNGAFVLHIKTGGCLIQQDHRRIL